MISEERYKQLMNDVGLPNSRSLLLALQQCAMEATIEVREKLETSQKEIQRLREAIKTNCDCPCGLLQCDECPR